MSSNKCPNCGKPKKPWFPLCWECQEKEISKPKCDVCGVEVPEGHNLCKEHWLEKQKEKQNIKKIDYVKKKKEEDFRTKFEGNFVSPYGKVKSKSELLISYFLYSNEISRVLYEPPLNLSNKEVRPDFVIDDGKGNTIILEHFSEIDEEYKKKMQEKIKLYDDLCKNESNFFFVYTTEDDICNLKDKVGSKLNETPLKKIIWK